MFDASSFEGACQLLSRIRAVRAARGMPFDLVVVHLGQDAGGDGVYGIREPRHCPPGAVINEKAKGGPTMRGVSNARAQAICSNTLLAHPGVTLEAVINGTKRPTRILARARRACISAVYASGAAPSLDALGRFFNLDSCTVSRALKSVAPQQVAA